MKITLLFLFTSILFLLCSCTEKHKSAVFSNDIESLKQYINLDSISPITGKWSHQTMGDEGGFGPTDYRITAVLSLEKETWQKLKEKAEKMPPFSTEQNFDQNFIKDWFPKNIKESFYLEDQYYNVSTNTYPVTLFSKGSFRNGFCFFIPEGEIFLFLCTT